MAGAAAPDGRTLVLAIQGSLWAVAAEGGEARRLTGREIEATSPSWSPDGTRIAFQNYAGHYYQLWTVAADGSDPRALTTGHADHREPAWSPDGRRIAFSSDRAGEGACDVWSLGVEDGRYQRWTRTGGAGACEAMSQVTGNPWAEPWPDPPCAAVPSGGGRHQIVLVGATRRQP